MWEGEEMLPGQHDRQQKFPNIIITKDWILWCGVAASHKSIADNDGFVLRCPLFISKHNTASFDEWVKSNIHYYTVIIQLQTNEAAQLRRREMDVEAEINNERHWDWEHLMQVAEELEIHEPVIANVQYVLPRLLMLPLEILPLALHFHNIVEWSLNLFQTKLEMIVASQVIAHSKRGIN